MPTISSIIWLKHLKRLSHNYNSPLSQHTVYRHGKQVSAKDLRSSINSYPSDTLVRHHLDLSISLPISSPSIIFRQEFTVKLPPRS